MKMLLVGLGIVAAIVGGGVSYLSVKTMTTPDWYASANSQPFSSAANASTNVGTPDISPNDVVISEGKLNQLVVDAIATQPYAAPIIETGQGIHTAIRDGRIESGVVMNLSELPRESLPAEGRQAVEQLTNTFPFLANRDVYLGIEGSPTVVDGTLSLDDTHVKIGQLKLPIASVASQLGLSQTALEQQIDGLLAQRGLTPEDVKIIDRQIVITGTN